ncbi:MAG TPA: hypothetical protein VD947_00735 [Patescibacteria group bacterium]|nr:hypothetical protein [Patescibacteria group bacterium]
MIQVLFSSIALAVPANGKVIVYDEDKIYSFNPDGTGETTVSTHDSDDIAAISSDGKRVVFGKDGSLFVSNIFGDNKKTIATNVGSGPIYNAVFSNDDSKIAYAGESAADQYDVYVYDIQSGSNTKLTSIANADSLSIAAFTLDSSKVVFGQPDYEDGIMDIKTVTVVGGSVTTVVSNGEWNIPLVVSPNNKLIYSKEGVATSSETTGAELRIIPVDASSASSQLADHTEETCEDESEITPCSVSSSFKAVFNSDGSKVAYSIEHGYANVGEFSPGLLGIVNADGITSGTTLDDSDPAIEVKGFSPDGQRILYEKTTSEDLRPHSISISGTSSIVYSPSGVSTNVWPGVWLQQGPTFTKGPNGTITTTINSGDDYSASSYTVVDKETLIVNGKIGNIAIQSGGILKGTGTVGVLDVLAGGTVAPGLSPGCLNAGNTTIAGIFEAEIGGTTVCTGYDQLKVTGTVDVTGGTLSTKMFNDFKPSVGNTFTILDNDGSDAITGTFANLAEGATFEVDGIVFKISYTGGSGNDIVLTVQSVPAAPNTGANLLQSNPLLVLFITSLCAGTLFGLSRKYGLISRN